MSDFEGTQDVETVSAEGTENTPATVDDNGGEESDDVAAENPE